MQFDVARTDKMGVFVCAMDRDMKGMSRAQEIPGSLKPIDALSFVSFNGLLGFRDALTTERPALASPSNFF